MGTYTPNLNLYKPDPSDPFGEFRAKFNDNMDILDNGGGGGDVMDVEVNGVSVVDGNKVAKITSYKEVTQAQYDALPASKLTDGIAYFIKDGGGSGSGGSFLLVITAETGETVTATKDGTTLTATEVSTGVYELEVTSAGTWTLSDGTNTATVDVGIYTVTLSSVPEGSTVLPTDDISIWLACGERTEGYTTLSQVLGDSVCLSALLNNNNANDYLVRSTTWASTLTADSSAMSYIGLNNYCSNTLLSDATWCNAICNSTYFELVLNVKVPVMTDNTHPSGVCSSTALQAGSAYYAFDNNASTNIVFINRQGRIIYKFDETVDIYAMRVTPRAGLSPAHSMLKTCTIDNSSDGNTWNNISTIVVADSITEQTFVFPKTTDMYFSLYATGDVWVSGINNSGVIGLQFYGRKDI